MRDYRKILAWQATHDLAKTVYVATKGFPSEERYGLTSQIRRAALSVPTNIVEGSARRTQRDYTHFLSIAWASLKETEYLLLFATELGFLEAEDAVQLQAKIDMCCSKLLGLQRSVNEEIKR